LADKSLFERLKDLFSSSIRKDEEKGVEMSGSHASQGVDVPESQIEAAIQVESKVKTALATLGTLLNSLFDIETSKATLDQTQKDPIDKVLQEVAIAITQLNVFSSEIEKKTEEESLLIEDGPGDNSAAVSQSETPSTEDLNVALVTRPASDNVPPVAEKPSLGPDHDPNSVVITADEFKDMMFQVIKSAVLNQGDPEKALKQEYHKLALKYHPDKNRENPHATENSARLSDQYKALLDSLPSTIDDIWVKFFNAQRDAFKDEIKKIMDTSSPYIDAAVGAYNKLKSAIAEYSRLVGQVKKGRPAQVSKDKAKEKINPLIEAVNKAIEDLKIASENIQPAREDTLTEQSVDESTEVEEEPGLSDDEKFIAAGEVYNEMLNDTIKAINDKIDNHVTDEVDRYSFKEHLNEQSAEFVQESVTRLNKAFEGDATDQAIITHNSYVEESLKTLVDNVDATLATFDACNDMFTKIKAKLSANQQIFISQVQGQIDVIAGYFLDGLSTAVSFKSETSDTLEKCTSYVKESLETLESKVDKVVTALETCSTKLTATTEEINAKIEEHVTTQKNKDNLKKHLDEQISVIQRESVGVLEDVLSDKCSEEKVPVLLAALQVEIDKALAALSAAFEGFVEAQGLGIPSGTVKRAKEALLNAKSGPFSTQSPTSSPALGKKKAGDEAQALGIPEGAVKQRQQELIDAGVGPFLKQPPTSSPASGKKKAGDEEKKAAKKAVWIMRGYLPQNTITRLEGALASIAEEVEGFNIAEAPSDAVQTIKRLQVSLASTGKEVDKLEKSAQHKGSKVQPVERAQSDEAIARLIAQKKELDQALKAIQAGLVRAAALKAGPRSAAKYGQQFLSPEKQAQYERLAAEAKAARSASVDTPELRTEFDENDQFGDFQSAKPLVEEDDSAKAQKQPAGHPAGHPGLSIDTTNQPNSEVLRADAAKDLLDRTKVLKKALNEEGNYEKTVILPMLIRYFHALKKSDPEVRTKLLVTIKLIDKDFDENEEPRVSSPRTITKGPDVAPVTPKTHLELLQELDAELDKLLHDNGHRISDGVKAGLVDLQVVVKHSISEVKKQATNIENQHVFKGEFKGLRGSYKLPENTSNLDNTEDPGDSPAIPDHKKSSRF